jgi:hypothetical protein
MRTLTLVVAALLVCGGCTSADINNDGRLESDQTFVAIFQQYNAERHNLPVSELRREFESLSKTVTEEDHRQIEDLYRRVDTSKVAQFLADDQLSLHNECMRHVECGAFALLTMQSWAKTQITPIQVVRSPDDQWVRFHYRGVDGEGRKANGYVDFINVKGEWKIKYEVFGGPDE